MIAHMSRLRCHDCDIDTSLQTGIGHDYIVHDALWLQATHGARVRFLCLDCLEKRLDRPVVEADFVATPVECIECSLALKQLAEKYPPPAKIPAGLFPPLSPPSAERQRLLDHFRAEIRKHGDMRGFLKFIWQLPSEGD
jgi:hypothetical protein